MRTTKIRSESRLHVVKVSQLLGRVCSALGRDGSRGSIIDAYLAGNTFLVRGSKHRMLYVPVNALKLATGSLGSGWKPAPLAAGCRATLPRVPPGASLPTKCYFACRRTHDLPFPRSPRRLDWSYRADCPDEGGRAGRGTAMPGRGPPHSRPSCPEEGACRG
jgi:hypothetical protein